MCPYCGSSGPFLKLKNGKLKCKRCGYKFEEDECDTNARSASSTSTT